MDLSAYRLRERTTIASSPDEIYDLLADVSAMGRWSPVCTGGEYDRDDARTPACCRTVRRGHSHRHLPAAVPGCSGLAEARPA